MLLQNEKASILKSIKMFSEISEKNLIEIAHHFEEIIFEKNSIIIKQGDLGTSMYIIVKGEVDILRNETHITTLGEKTIFGELAALDPEPRNATVKSNKETLVFKLEGSVIYNLISEFPEIAKGIIKILCERVRSQA